MASEARLFRGEGSGRLFPGRDGIRFSFPHQWGKEGCKACDGVRYLAGFPFFCLDCQCLMASAMGGYPFFIWKS